MISLAVLERRTPPVAQQGRVQLIRKPGGSLPRGHAHTIANAVLDDVSTRRRNSNSFGNDLGSRVRLLFEGYLNGKHGIRSDQASSRRNCLASCPIVKKDTVLTSSCRSKRCN